MYDCFFFIIFIFNFYNFYVRYYIMVKICDMIMNRMVVLECKSFGYVILGYYVI